MIATIRRIHCFINTALFGRAYNGANGKKIAVEYSGKPYMLKFSPSGEGTPTELSYTSGTELEDVLEVIEKQQYVDPVLLKKHFWEMFVADALLGNFDRHNGNWGFLYDPKKKQCEIAPVYDCGSCLLPQADDSVMQAILTDKDALNLRIYRFPTSAIKLDGNKINYYDFLSNAK